MKAFDIMTWGAISVRADEPILRAAQLMLEHRLSGLPVLDLRGNLVGIVTEADLLSRSSGTDLAGRSVEGIMTRSPYCIAGDTPLKEILELMAKHRIKRLPVVDDRHVIGIVGRAEIVRALVNFARQTKAQPEEALRTKTARDDVLIQLRPGLVA